MTLVDIAALATLWWTRRGPPDPPTTSDLVAVFPFTVEGSPEVQYLGTGLVELLSTNLEGAGEIRSVDPRALLGWLAQRDAPVQTPAQARDASARFGAGLYLLGNVVESGGRLHLRVAMYDHERGDEPVALAAVQGEASDLFSLVDQLTTQLLAQVRGPPIGDERPLRLLHRQPHRIAPLGPRPVVVPHLVEAEQVGEREPGVRGALADPAVGDRLLRPACRPLSCS